MITKITKLLTLKKDRNYIKLYKAYPVVNLRKNSCSPIYIFKTQKQCQKFIESKELEPYLMMFKLTE